MAYRCGGRRRRRLDLGRALRGALGAAPDVHRRAVCGRSAADRRSNGEANAVRRCGRASVRRRHRGSRGNWSRPRPAVGSGARQVRPVVTGLCKRAPNSTRGRTASFRKRPDGAPDRRRVSRQCRQRGQRDRPSPPQRDGARRRGNRQRRAHSLARHRLDALERRARAICAELDAARGAFAVARRPRRHWDAAERVRGGRRHQRLDRRRRYGRFAGASSASHTTYSWDSSPPSFRRFRCSAP